MAIHCLILFIFLFLLASNSLSKSIPTKYGCGDAENEWAYILVDRKPFCYKAFHLEQSFESAEKSCSDLHKSSHLASFHSNKEFQAIAALLLLPSGSASHFWTGLYRLKDTALPTFYFTDGSKYNWPIPAQLLNTSNEDSANKAAIKGHSLESVKPELLELETKYCVQVTSHHGKVVLQEQDCKAKLKFVCKKPATLLQAFNLAQPLIIKGIQSTTEKSSETTIYLLKNNRTLESISSTSQPTLSPTATSSTIDLTSLIPEEFLSNKTDAAELLTPTTDSDSNSSTSDSPTATSDEPTVNLTSVGAYSSATDDPSSTFDITETSSSDSVIDVSGERMDVHHASTSPCFSIATFTWTCVEGELLVFD